MIKELLNSNRQLREVIDLKNDSNEKLHIENETLQEENQDLRDKVDIISALIKPETDMNSQQLDLYKVFLTSSCQIKQKIFLMNPQN